MSQTKARQNFHVESEAWLNEQINLELHASYVYMSLSYYFDRDDVSFSGMRDFFKKRSQEERGHAEQLMSYQNRRGGRIVLKNINKPDNDEWGTMLDAMEAALKLEKDVNQSLLNLHNMAEKHGDAEMAHYIGGDFLHGQVKDIRELSDHITNLQRVGGGLGEYMYDQKL